MSRLHQIAADFASGFRTGLTWPAAIAELTALGADADELSQAAARHAVADNWYAITAVDLLLAAGAEQRLIERHLSREWLARQSGADDSTPPAQRRAS